MSEMGPVRLPSEISQCQRAAPGGSSNLPRLRRSRFSSTLTRIWSACRSFVVLVDLLNALPPKRKKQNHRWVRLSWEMLAICCDSEVAHVGTTSQQKMLPTATHLQRTTDLRFSSLALSYWETSR